MPNWVVQGLGFSYVPGSLRARLPDNLEIEELHPGAGTYRVNTAGMAPGSRIEIDYERPLYRASTSPTQVFGGERPAVGACIYCGTVARLSDEHIVPLALQGPWLLRHASCPTCATTTSQWELHVLREVLGPARATLGMRSRRPRPPTFPLRTRGQEAGWSDVDLPVDEYPSLITLPIFGPPANEARAGAGLEIRDLWRHQVGTSHEQVAASLGATEVRQRIEIDAFVFARWVCKIALGFAIAAGLNFESELGDLMLSEPERMPEVFGSLEQAAQPVDGMHALEPGLKDGALCVRVTLFPQFGGPTYEVIVGRLVLGPVMANGGFVSRADNPPYVS